MTYKFTGTLNEAQRSKEYDRYKMHYNGEEMKVIGPLVSFHLMNINDLYTKIYLNQFDSIKIDKIKLNQQ